ncbi:hypothetical protein AO069_15880 [Pseudomonas syringae pv. syringae PD2774]|nr:hypothetical protein AO069_15880 [Pseudomonas syringae pv. syringae PD2774]
MIFDRRKKKRSGADTSSEAEEFTVTGIDISALVTIRDIVGLVLEVKGEMRLRRLASDRQKRACKG